MMEAAPRYLTKSRFKLALECPTKLYYTKKSEYPDKKLDDDFLAALANGGFQVGELAKYYFPGGVDITSLDYDIALNETSQFLAQENAIIYEAAFKYENLFIRADVVVKKGNSLEVYEVKAKSIDPINDSIVNTRGMIAASWKPYVYDIAFQKHVISKAFPKYHVQAFLMLADKSKRASVDGLNQKFFLSKDEEGRKGIEVVGDVSLEALGEKILVAVLVDHIIDPILTSDSFSDQSDRSFVDWIAHYSEHYAKDIRISSSIGAHCNSCEFKARSIEEKEGLKNGFKECWREQAGFGEEEFHKPSILDVWDFRGKNSAIVEGRYFQSDFTREDFEPKTKSKTDNAGLSRVDRQTLQIEKSNTNDDTHYFDIDGLTAEMQNWKHPLHFIDFETSAVAIPFNKDRRPYEQTAFQYSHHIVYEDGTIKHQGEWLNTEAGNFPNFNFVRALKAELEIDDGTIFRYAAHENSILNAIYIQLRDSEEEDKDDLCNWIKTITKSSGSSAEKWEGDRNMVDLCEMVKSYYYHPNTKGSNSIKAVLPAILNSSDYLKEKYSKPIYGREIISRNFKDKSWVTFNEEGKVIDPYKQLEPIFQNIDPDILDELITDSDAGLADGGAAMTAYAQMQFTQMSPKERQAIQDSLLKYCELDTLAMVMIWEGWNNL